MPGSDHALTQRPRTTARSRQDDQREREIAARIGRDFPHWLVMWGAHSREFWAYPRFGAPRGTIAHSADPDDLAAMMRAIDAAAERDQPGWRP